MSYEEASVTLQKLLMLAWRQRRQNGIQPHKIAYSNHINTSHGQTAACPFVWDSVNVLINEAVLASRNYHSTHGCQRYKLFKIYLFLIQEE